MFSFWPINGQKMTKNANNWSKTALLALYVVFRPTKSLLWHVFWHKITLKNRIFVWKNQKFHFLMPQRTKNDKKTSIINQKQYFQSSMGRYNSIGICCSMVLDTKLSKDFKFSIKNRKLSVSDPYIGQNMTKNASKWPATYPWCQSFANRTKSDLNTSSPRVKTNDSALESW